MRKEPRLGREGMPGIAELGERVLVQPGLGGETVGKTGKGSLEEFRQALVRGRKCRGESDANEVERGGERDDVQVRHRDDSLLVDDDKWVRARRVQFECELPRCKLERVGRCSQDLREPSEGEGV